MVSVTSASRNITSASRYHLRYQSTCRSLMYICGPIPRNFAESAEAVLIVFKRAIQLAIGLKFVLSIHLLPCFVYPSSQCSGVPVYAKTKPQIAQLDQDHIKIIRDDLTIDNGRGLILRVISKLSDTFHWTLT